MRSIAVLSLIVALSGTAVAQLPTSRNAIYLEFLGNGLMYSINYDRLFTESFGMRVGASYSTPAGHFVTFPLMANYFVSWGSSKLEMGLGACVILQPEYQSVSFMAATDEDIRGNGVLATATLGYRYQPTDGGFVFRVGVTPFYGKFSHDISPTPYEDVTEDVYRFRLSGGISVGYGF
jgi:hypothetical protein